MSKLEKCPECGEVVDARGLRGHMKLVHGAEPEEVTGSNESVDGGRVDPRPRGVQVSLDDLSSGGVEQLEKMPETTVTEDAVTVRSGEIREVVVSDQELMQDVVEALTSAIRENGGV